MHSLASRLIASFLAVGLAVGPRPITAQSPSQTPIFKGRLDVVRTDVTVIDNKTGKPVSGLTERDFTISENGVRQTIASFADAALGGAPTNPDDPANRRVFLFILAPGVNNEPYKKYEGVAEFIRERLRPQDLVGVMSLGRLSSLTADHERIAAIVDRLKRPLPLEFEAIRQRTAKTDQSVRSVEAERYADNWMEPGSADTGFFKSTVTFALGSAQEGQNVGAFFPWYSRVMWFASLRVVAGIEYLRAIPGDKHLVVLTSGFDPPIKLMHEGVGLFLRSEGDDKRLAADANNAGVALDLIQTNDIRTTSSANLAKYSGGQFSSLRIAEQQLARIDEGTRRGYIIGYMPSNPDLDGKYRDIEVAVNRKNVTVVYRHGYTAAADPPPIDPREIFTHQRLRDAAAGTSDVNDIVLKVHAATVLGAAPQVRVDLNIDINPVPLSEKGDKREAEFDLLILCADRTHDVIGRLDQRMTLGLTQAQYDQVKLSGVPYSTSIPVTGRAAVVKVIVYHFDSDRIGVFTINIKSQGRTMALAGCVSCGARPTLPQRARRSGHPEGARACGWRPAPHDTQPANAL